MENASKALIIAGAILLSILIISLGIMIFQNAKEVVDGNAMNEVANSQFNEKFNQYTGDKVKGTNVKAMVKAVIQHNLQQEDESTQVIITGSIVTLAKNANAASTDTIKNGNFYKVSTVLSKQGLVESITVENAK